MVHDTAVFVKQIHRNCNIYYKLQVVIMEWLVLSQNLLDFVRYPTNDGSLYSVADLHYQAQRRTPEELRATGRVRALQCIYALHSPYLPFSIDMVINGCCKETLADNPPIPATIMICMVKSYCDHGILKRIAFSVQHRVESFRKASLEVNLLPELIVENRISVFACQLIY